MKASNLIKIVVFFICLVSINSAIPQQIETKNSIKKVLNIVIVINGVADEYLYPQFIKYREGQPFDTLKGIYIPGKIEFDLADFNDFKYVESDSIIIEFDSYQQLTNSFELYPYKYSFLYYQSDFDADCQVYQLERMCIRSYREKYFKNSRKHKGGYVVIYNIGQTSIPILNNVKSSDD